MITDQANTTVIKKKYPVTFGFVQPELAMILIGCNDINFNSIKYDISFYLRGMGYLQLSDHVAQKSSHRRANDALGHVEQRKFKFGGFL